MLTSAMKSYSGPKDLFRYLGASSPIFDYCGINEYLYISSSKDFTIDIKQSEGQLKRIDPQRCLMPISKSKAIYEHEFACPTTRPCIEQAVKNVYKTNKFLR